MICINRSRNPNKFKLWSLLLPSLVYLNNPITLTGLLIVVTMHINSITVFSAVISPISNGTAPFTPVGLVTKFVTISFQLHLNTLHLHFISFFWNLAYLISLIPGHEPLSMTRITYLWLMSIALTHSCTIIRYDPFIALTHICSIYKPVDTIMFCS
jgi:hypothetical protein